MKFISCLTLAFLGSLVLTVQGQGESETVVLKQSELGAPAADASSGAPIDPEVQRGLEDRRIEMERKFQGNVNEIQQKIKQYRQEIQRDQQRAQELEDESRKLEEQADRIEEEAELNENVGPTNRRIIAVDGTVIDEFSDNTDQAIALRAQANVLRQRSFNYRTQAEDLRNKARDKEEDILKLQDELTGEFGKFDEQRIALNEREDRLAELNPSALSTEAILANPAALNPYQMGPELDGAIIKISQIAKDLSIRWTLEDIFVLLERAQVVDAPTP